MKKRANPTKRNDHTTLFDSPLPAGFDFAAAFLALNAPFSGSARRFGFSAAFGFLYRLADQLPQTLENGLAVSFLCSLGFGDNVEFARRGQPVACERSKAVERRLG